MLTSHDSHSTMVQDKKVLIEPSEDLAIEIYEAVKKVCWCKARPWRKDC